MDGVLTVIDMLGNTISSLKLEVERLTAENQDLKQMIAEREAAHAERLSS